MNVVILHIFIKTSGFADGRNEMSPVSECEVDDNEVKSTIATSEKQIQDSGFEDIVRKSPFV